LFNENLIKKFKITIVTAIGIVVLIKKCYDLYIQSNLEKTKKIVNAKKFLV